MAILQPPFARAPTSSWCFCCRRRIEIAGAKTAPTSGRMWEVPDLKPWLALAYPFLQARECARDSKRALRECSYELARYVRAFSSVENRDPKG